MLGELAGTDDFTLGMSSDTANYDGLDRSESAPTVGQAYERYL